MAGEVDQYTQFSDLVVKNGPFKGMRYLQAKAVNSYLLPKLLGSYEKEIELPIEKVCNTRYKVIINIGCAEGYYAVGLAKRIPSAKVYAYDINKEAIKLTKEMVEVNEITNLTTDSYYDILLVQQLISDDYGFVLCDCEGCERNFFTKETIFVFKNCDLLIETHDFVYPGTFERIFQLFEATHLAQIFESISDDEKAEKYKYDELKDYNKLQKKDILAEHRPAIMKWLFLMRKI